MKFEYAALEHAADGERLSWVEDDRKPSPEIPEGCEVAATRPRLREVAVIATRRTRALFGQLQMQCRPSDTPEKVAERFWRLVRVLRVPAAVIDFRTPGPRAAAPAAAAPAEPPPAKPLAPKPLLSKTPSKVRGYTRGA